METVNQSCFESFVRKHRQALWMYLRTLGCDQEEASDLSQESFLALLKSKKSLEELKSPQAYLFGIARHCYFSFLRKKGRELPQQDELYLIEQAWQTFVPEGEVESSLIALEECLSFLAPKAEKAIILRFKEQCKREEISKKIGISATSVTKLIQRAKAELRKCIQKKLKKAKL